MATVGNIIRLVDTNEDDNILSKVRYQIVATNWSNSTDTSGYYTYTLTLNPTLTLNYSPNIWIAGATDNTLATDTEKAQYDLLNEQCNLTSESTLVLYAKAKPTSNFYIFVESKASGSGGGNPFSNLTPFFYAEHLKSGLVTRTDNKGYESTSQGWSNHLTSIQKNTLNNSKCVLLKLYSNLTNIGLLDIYESLVLLKNGTYDRWFFTNVNQIYPNRWIQCMSASTDWDIYCIMSSELYGVLSSSDKVFAIEYYIIA